MRTMHQFLSTVPFDLYELALFHLVVKHRSFTKAAEIAGLTQSAITRQMQGVENSLGIQSRFTRPRERVLLHIVRRWPGACERGSLGRVTRHATSALHLIRYP